MRNRNGSKSSKPVAKTAPVCLGHDYAGAFHRLEIDVSTQQLLALQKLAETVLPDPAKHNPKAGALIAAMIAVAYPNLASTFGMSKAIRVKTALQLHSVTQQLLNRYDLN